MKTHHSEHHKEQGALLGAPSQRLKVYLASMLGNTLEIYDFTLYGAFSSIIAASFFPPTDPTAAMLSVFATFALGYVTRPIGAILFGHLGDSIGRKKTLALTIITMAVPTVMIGLLPTYETIGIAAPIILILARLVQGISAGGEYNGAAIFMIEHSPPHRKNLAASMATVSGALGAALAMLIGSIVLSITSLSWAWRLPFFVGIILGTVGFYIRTKLEESPEFSQVVEKKKPLRSPLLQALKTHPLEILCCAGGAGFAGSLVSTSSAFMPSFLIRHLNFPQDSSLFYTMIGISSLVLLAPVAGWAADRWGQKKVMSFGAVGVFCTAYALFEVFQLRNPLFVVAGLFLFNAICVCYIPILNAFMNKLLPPEIRFSGIAFGYGMGLALFGGAMPLASTYLIQQTGSLSSPSFYLMGSAILGLGVILLGEKLYVKQQKKQESLLSQGDLSQGNF